jgi:hypothetical protein
VVGAIDEQTPLSFVHGQIDEGAISTCLIDGSFVVCDNTDADGDGVSICQGDCDDDAGARFPGNPEVCDGLDNDCNEAVDEGLDPTPTTCGVGECAGNVGQLECQNGTPVDTCDPLDGALPDDQCDGLDNDCDGTDDDDYVPTPTACGLGECAGNVGQLECQNGTPVDTCDPLDGALPDDQCDDLDNDCDGTADDDYVPTPTTCGVGECAGNTGELICSGGVPVDTCDPLAGATPEACDGLDNNCDDVTDEGFPNTDGDPLADCVDPDDDNDGVPDGEDCAPLDDTASVPAIEVDGVLAHGGPTTLLIWADQGPGFRYDVAGGFVPELLADQDTTGAACLSDDEPSASFQDTRPAPASGSPYYYIIRAQNACGAGPYGFASSGAPRDPSADCP